MTPLVTAVIPAYNYGRFVARAVESVLAQTYPALECIVVDDGSQDETPRVLARYAGRIRTIVQPNQGLSAARNTGIRAALGEYVALLDADDWWESRKIARQVEVAEGRPCLGAIGVGITARTLETKYRFTSLPRQPCGTWRDDLRAMAQRQLWLGGSGSGVMAPRRVFDEVGFFDQTLRAAEDWDMWMRIIARYPIANVSEPLANITVHETGVFRNARLMEENQFRCLQLACQRWPEVFNATLRRRVSALILADAGGELVQAGDLEQGFRKYCASLAEWPFVGARWRSAAIVGVKQLFCRA